MSAPYHCIRSKLDRALVLYVIARGAGTAANTFPGKRASDVSLPANICFADRATPIPNTGSYTCRTAIIHKANPADDTPAASDAAVAALFDCFFTIEDDSAWDSKKVAAQITAAARAGAIADPANYADLADFTALDVRHGDEEGTFESDGDLWVETLNLEIDAAPSNVS